MNKFEIWEEGSEWIARDQQGNEKSGPTPGDALDDLIGENIVRHNLETGRTCNRCEFGCETGGGLIRCGLLDLWDENVDDVPRPTDNWDEFNDRDNTCRHFLGGV